METPTAKERRRIPRQITGTWINFAHSDVVRKALRKAGVKKADVPSSSRELKAFARRVLLYEKEQITKALKQEEPEKGQTQNGGPCAPIFTGFVLQEGENRVVTVKHGDRLLGHLYFQDEVPPMANLVIDHGVAKLTRREK